MNSQDDPRVAVEEQWIKRDGTVFHRWRVEGGEWHLEETALPEVPYVQKEGSHE